MKSVAVSFVALVLAAVATAHPQPGGLLGVGVPVASPALVSVGAPVVAGGWGAPALLASPGIIGAPGVIGVKSVGIGGIGLGGIGLSGLGLGAGKIW